MNPLKIKAEELRRLGYSYGMIQEKLSVSKSTLSNWLNKIAFNPNKEVVEKVGRARLKSALYKQKLKFRDSAEQKQDAAKEVGRLTKRDLFMLGIGIYLGEGSKAIEEVKVANSDSQIIKLVLKWLQEFCKLEMRHFRITLHGYPDIDQKRALRFWSKETAIPLTQFTKIVVDRRVNKSRMRHGKLPYGTAHLYVRSGGTIVPGVRSLHRKIMGWLESAARQV